MIQIRLERVRNGICLTSRLRGFSFCRGNIRDALKHLGGLKYRRRNLLAGPVGRKGTVTVYAQRRYLSLSSLDLLLYVPVAVFACLWGAGSVLVHTSPFLGGMNPVDAFLHFLSSDFVDLMNRSTISLSEASMLWLSLYGAFPLIIVSLTQLLALRYLGHFPTRALRLLVGEIRENGS